MLFAVHIRSLSLVVYRSVGNRKSSANNRNSGNVLTSCFIGLRFRLTGPTAHFGLIKIIGAPPYFPQLTVVHISLAWFSLYSGLQEYRRPCSQEHMSNCTKCQLVKCSYVYRATLQICRLNFYFLICPNQRPILRARAPSFLSSKCIWLDELSYIFLFVRCFTSYTSLSQVENIKFPGVIIDDKLTWQPHLSSLLLVIKLSCCTGRLNRITQFIPSDHHTSLYHTLFESYLSYGVSVWGGAKPSKLKPVFKAQKNLFVLYLVIEKSI